MVENETLSSAAKSDEPLADAEMPAAAVEEAEPGGQPSGTEPLDACPQASLTLKRAGAETDDVFGFTSPAVVGRFDPTVGPVEVDLGVIDEGRYVSRKHARICFEEGVWKIQDLGSSNGTYVLRGDFERVEEAELKDGDEVAFGNARFVFKAAQEAPEPDAAPDAEE